MKKLVSMVALATLLTSNVLAEDFIQELTSGGKTYAGVGGAVEYLGEFDNGMAIEFYAGMVFENNFGAEVKITQTISEPTVTDGSYTIYYNGSVDLDDITADITTISLFATYNYMIDSTIVIVPKLGFTRYGIDVEDGNNKESDDAIGLSYGIDAKYDIGNMNLYMGYTIYNPDLKFNSNTDSSHFSFGVQKTF